MIYPSFYNGLYARNGDDSVAPHLWKDLIAAWVPSWGDTGRELHDLSGHGHHGAIPNPQADAGFVPSPGGKHGLVYQFSYDNTDWFEIAQTAELDQATELTIISYANLDQISAGPSYIICTNDAGSAGYGLQFTNADPAKLKFLGGGSVVGQDVAALSGDTWYQCVVTCTDNGANIAVKLYVDGVLSKSGTTANAEMTMGADSLWLGKRPSSADAAYAWDGYLGPVLMYKRCLGAQEILEHYVNPVKFLRSRKRVYGVVAAAPPGNAMPMAMNHYRRRRVG